MHPGTKICEQQILAADPVLGKENTWGGKVVDGPCSSRGAAHVQGGGKRGYHLNSVVAEL
jgi:hypothetical protein